MRAKKSNRREALASGATAARDGGGAALGFVAGKKSVLAFAADFRRLILAFHKFKSRWARTPFWSGKEYQ